MKRMTFRPNGHLLGVADGAEVETFAVNGALHVFSIASRCGTCDEYPAFYAGGTDVKVRTACPYQDGLTSVITLAVPSGKIIVSDDLRPVYDWQEDGMASYNSALGQKQAVEAMAAIGCAYGPVGNSCPGLYRTGDDTYVIASPDPDGEDLPDKNRLAGIITDLWAYSIADLDDWRARGGDPGSLSWAETVVNIRPGTYEFTHHTWEPGFNSMADGTIVFAHVRRIGD